MRIPIEGPGEKRARRARDGYESWVAPTGWRWGCREEGRLFECLGGHADDRRVWVKLGDWRKQKPSSGSGVHTGEA